MLPCGYKQRGKNRVIKWDRTGNWNEGGLRMTRYEEEIKPIIEGPPK